MSLATEFLEHVEQRAVSRAALQAERDALAEYKKLSDKVVHSAAACVHGQPETGELHEMLLAHVRRLREELASAKAQAEQAPVPSAAASE